MIILMKMILKLLLMLNLWLNKTDLNSITCWDWCMPQDVKKEIEPFFNE